MSRVARFRVTGRLDDASRVQAGTVTISRDALPMFEVRPLRRRRTYSLTLDAVADLVVKACVAFELRQKRLAKAAKKAERRKAAKNG